MSKNRVPKFKDYDKEDRNRKKKKNKVRKPYSRAEKHRKSWEEYIDNEKDSER